MRVVTVNNFCLCTYDGAEFWISTERAELVKRAMAEKVPSIEIDKNCISIKNIAGIYTAQVMAEKKNTKKGLVKCPAGKWHPKTDPPCSGGCVIKKKHVGIPAISEEQRLKNRKIIRELKGEYFGRKGTGTIKKIKRIRIPKEVSSDVRQRKNK